jgi:predicted GNAT family N-acyltransferase
VRLPSLGGWLMNLEAVKKAATQAEREAIYRFRYEVYIEELKYHYPSADHEHRWLPHEEDDKPYTTLLYTGTPGAVTSVAQIRAWEPGQVPARDFEALSLDLFPGIEDLRVAQIGRLMVRKSLRGRLLLPSLLRAGYEFLAGEARTDLAFVDCAPGIVRYYRKLGALPYGGRLLIGPGIPLLLVPSDYERLRRLGSPVAPLVKKYFGPGKRPPLDLTRYRHLVEGDAVPVEMDPEKVWKEFESRLIGGGPRLPTLLEGVPLKAVKRLTASGFLLTVGAGDLVTGKGIEEREMYVILEGRFEVVVGERRIAVLERGEIFGDIAFFTRVGERAASVSAVTPGRLLVLRRKFLRELTKRDPEAGFQILMNVTRIMAERLAGMLRTPADGAS